MIEPASVAAVIFDFDGTIALSEPVHMQAWRDIAAVVGKRLPDGFLEKGIGHTDQELVADLSTAWNHSPGFDELLVMKRQAYQKRCLTESVLVPGAAEFIAALAQKLPLGIATSASAADIAPTLELYRLGKYFRTIKTVESVSRPKPDPEIYLAAAAALGVAPGACLVFEDTPTGATAARAAGMAVVGLSTSYPHAKLEPLLAGITSYEPLEALLDLVLRVELGVLVDDGRQIL